MSESNTAKKTVRKLAKLAERPYVPTSDVPYEELRHLVRQHKAITKASVAIDNMARDKKNRETGETIKCRLPEDVQVDLQETAKRQRQRASSLERSMLKELRKIPVYNEFLKQVFGCGPIVASYLLAEVDIRKAVKPSNLRRFCGLGIDPVTRRLERNKPGERAHFSSEMRTRLWQMFSAMWKNSYSGGRMVKSSKYLDVWLGWIHRKESQDIAFTVDATRLAERVLEPDEPITRERVIRVEETRTRKRDGRFDETEVAERAEEANEPQCDELEMNADATIPMERAILPNETKEEKRKKTWAKPNGWAKACDVFLFDLYTIWRTFEGLPAWPTYMDGVLRGVQHGTGEPVVNAPRMLTRDQALEMVGFPGARPLVQAAE